MIFTSGTSGDPKAVQVQHMMPIFAGSALAERYSVDTSDVCYLSMPLFHSNSDLRGLGRRDGDRRGDGARGVLGIALPR